MSRVWLKWRETGTLGSHRSGEISQCASVILGKDKKRRSGLDQSGPWKSGDALEFHSDDSPSSVVA